MTDTSDTHTYRRTALKIAGAGLGLAGFAGTGAAHPGNSQGQGQGRGNSQNDDEDEQEQHPGQGRGQWCCSCGWGRDQGPGYRRGYPHEDDETRWDGWEPGDGRPPWARGDGEDEDDDEDEDDEPGPPENPGNGDGDEDEDEDEDDDTDDDAPDEGDQEPTDPPEEEPDEDDPDEGDDSDSDDEDDTDDGDTGDDTDSGNGDGSDDSDDDSDDTDDSDDESDFVTQVEERVHALTNEYRQEQDVPTLDQSDELADVARAHSEDMAENDYFSHDSQDGSGPGDRLDEAGVECNGWAENLAYEQSSHVTEGDAESIANSALDGWIDSEGHRQNLLGNYDEEGIGVGVREDEVYITQVFCSN